MTTRQQDIKDKLLLFEVPQYGGDELFVRKFKLDGIEELVDLARSWA